MLLLSRHLGLEPRQVLSLLADDCLYFGHLVVKGKRNSFVEVLNIFNELLSKVKQVSALCHDPKELQFLLHMLKPCLLSRNRELPLLAMTILQQIHQQQEGDCYPMLNTPNGIVSSWCLAIKRHPDILSEMFRSLVVLANGRYNGLLLIDMRTLSASDSEYLNTINALLRIVDLAKFVREDCLSGILTICETFSQRENTDILLAVLALVHEIYSRFSSYIL